jgi:hypothetical protein
MPFLAVAQTQPLSLKQGVYVPITYECFEAPHAAILSWDGVGFSGPHSSKCTSDFETKDGKLFQVSTKCYALGDGSLDTSGHVDTFTLSRQSSDRFEMVKAGTRGVVYRWCGTPQSK